MWLISKHKWMNQHKNQAIASQKETPDRKAEEREEERDKMEAQ